MIFKTFEAKEIELKPKALFKALGEKLKTTDYKAKAAEMKEKRSIFSPKGG